MKKEDKNTKNNQEEIQSVLYIRLIQCNVSLFAFWCGYM